MHHLGSTRSTLQPTHLLHTPDAFVRAKLPGMDRATAIVHVSPTLGAKFSQYTAEFENEGTLGPTPFQRFIYVLEGALQIKLRGVNHRLEVNDYAYFPEASRTR